MARWILAGLVLAAMALTPALLPSGGDGAPEPDRTAAEDTGTVPTPGPPVPPPEPGSPELPLPPPGEAGQSGYRPRPPPGWRLRLAGTLVEFGGEPIPHGRVDLRSKTGMAVGAYKAQTDGEGRFRFDDLPAGAYVVSHDVRGGGTVEREVRVSDGKNTVCLRLPPGRELIVRLEDEEGRPVEGAKVRVFDHRGSLMRSPTGPAGSMRFFLTRGFTAVRATRPDVPGKPPLLPAGATRLPPEGTPLVLVLRVADTIEGTVIAPSGAGVSEAEVVVFEGEEEGESATTDAKGRFSVRAPRGEVVDLVIDGSRGRHNWMQKHALYATARIEAVAVGTRKLRVTLNPATWDRTLTLRLEAPDGSPVSGARIRVFSRASYDPLKVGRSDAEGRVHLKEMPSVPVTVTVLFGGDASEEWLGPRRVPLVANGQAEVLRFRRTVTVRGTVLDGRGHAPGKCELAVTEAGGGQVAHGRTAQDGSFSLQVPDDAALPLTIRAHRDAKQEPPNWGLLRFDRLDVAVWELRLDGSY